MGKGKRTSKKKRKYHSADDTSGSDDDGEGSISSAFTDASSVASLDENFEGEETMVLGSEIESSLENSVSILNEKRRDTSSRVSALKNIHTILSRSYTQLQSSLLTDLFKVLCNSISKPPKSTQSMACRSLGALAISCGDNSEIDWEGAQSILSVFSDKSWAVSVDGLLSALVCGVRVDWIDRARKWLLSEEDEVVVSGLEHVALDMSVSLQDEEDRGAFIDEYGHFIIDLLVPLLQSNNVDCRMGAGMCLAVLFDAIHRELEDEEEHEDDDVDYDGEDPVDDIKRVEPWNVPVVRSGWLDDDAIITLRSLRSDASRYRAKHERRTQRRLFRDVVRTVEDGLSFRDKFTVSGAEIYISSWAERVLLDSITAYIGHGLNSHFFRNEFVQEMFCIDARFFRRKQTCSVRASVAKGGAKKAFGNTRERRFMK